MERTAGRRTGLTRAELRVVLPTLRRHSACRRRTVIALHAVRMSFWPTRDGPPSPDSQDPSKSSVFSVTYSGLVGNVSIDLSLRHRLEKLFIVLRLGELVEQQFHRFGDRKRIQDLSQYPNPIQCFLVEQ